MISRATTERNNMRMKLDCQVAGMSAKVSLATEIRAARLVSGIDAEGSPALAVYSVRWVQ